MGAHRSVIALFGPTGVGKTELAVELARRLRDAGEYPVAVSADALQVYRGLEVLTGVATWAQRSELEHRLVSVVSVDARFSVGEYARLAHAEIDSLLRRGRLPLVVGGTGLYLRAALADLALGPSPPARLRAHWQDRAQRDGLAALHDELARRAPWAAQTIHPADRHRLIRALELSDLGALRPSVEPSQLWTSQTRHPTRLIGLTMERSELYARIDARVEAMVAAGAVAQVRAAEAAGASATARRALGFSELLSGDVEAMKRRSRHYARRQLTWMRKLSGVELVDVSGRDADELAASLTSSPGPASH